ncbi:Ig-like domain-containing protein [Thiothrix fructosivorans]
MLDTWEQQYSFDQLNSADAGTDADNDGFTNKQEHDANAHPRDAKSYPVKAKVSTVIPETANVGEKITVIVTGTDLPDTLDMQLADCAGIQKLAGATATEVKFTCTFSSAGTKSGTIKDKAGSNYTLKTFSLNVSEVLPDLRPVNLQIPASVKAGASINVSVDIENIGGTATPASSLGVWLSEDDVLSGNEALPPVPIPAVLTSTSANVSFDVYIPEHITSNYRLFVKADAAQVVTESNEDNNQITANLVMEESCIAYNEPDSQFTAIPIGLNTSIQRSICPAGDVDWLTFTLPSPSSLRLETSGASGHDTFMTLYDWKFDSNTAKSDDDSGEGYYSKLLFDCTAPLPAGKYIVKINQYADNARIPDYSLHLQDVKACVTDSDGDGFLDDNDAFPNDPKEWLDTDGDGSGNNADSDDDNDGMPDTWEEQHGFDSLNKTDADQDADNDGFTNKQEHDAGTDPKDAKSYPITAKVYSVEPLVADVNENTVFTVKGIKLPNTLAFWIGYCEGLTKLPNATETQVQFSCTPSRAEKLQGLVKDKSGGSLLMEFFVEASVLDKDQDGIKDTLDNCPEIKNTDQKDLDRDKIGDVCDTDRDGDSVSNDQDAFPDDKAESKDNDKDGIGNNADPDDDNDGMPDTWEEQHGLDPLNSTDATQDADKDSFTNKQEYDAGTDPKNAKSYPVTATISSVTPNTAIVGKRLELVITGKNLTGSIDVTLSGCDDMQIRTDGVYPQLSPKSALKNAVAPPTAPPPPPGTLPPLPGVGDLVNQFTASCMPTAAGLKTGVIRDKAGSDYILKQFEVTVANVDTTPEPFPFTHQTGVALSALISSNEITVSGINTATAISVTGGKYSINGGAYVSTAGTVSNGDKVKVQHTSSASYATKTETVVTIGGIAETFISTTKVNNAPTANAGIDQTVDSGANVTLTGSGADVDGDAIAHNWVQTAGTPTVSLMGAATSSPSFTAPQVSQDTKFTFTLTVSDGKGGTMSDTVDVTVKAAVDTKPDLFTFTDQIGVAFSSIMTSNEITVSGINTATAIAVTGGKYSINGGAYVSTAGTVSNGDKVKVQHMSSASYATKTETVVTIGGIAETFISTTKVNTPPTAQGSDETLNEDTPKTITLIATDSEDDKLTYTIVTQPKNGQAPLIGNTVTYKPNTNFNGKDSFTFKANDGNTDSAVATVNLQINAVNDAPTANAGIDQTVDSGANVTLTGSGADVDGDAIAHNWVQTAGTPTVSLIGATTSSPSFTAPQVSQDTKFTFTLTVSDGKGGTMSDSVDVTVKAAVDTKPDLFTFTDQIGVAFSSIMTSNEITVSGINTVTAIAVTGGKYSINGGGYVSTAGTVSNGDKVKVQHTSSASYATKTETVVTIGGIAETFISTTKVNTPPTAKDQVLSVTDGKALAFTLEGSDTDGDTLTYKITQSATNGTLLGSGNQFTYTPQAKWSGTEVITFTVSDGNAVSAPATIRITVTAVDTTPDAIVFTPKTDVDLSSLMESNAVKISGINTNVPISITGGEYSIDGAAYTSASATVSTGATLKVRHTSAASHASKTETVLTVGDVSATFTSLTRAEQTKADLVVSVTNQPNVTPDEFTSHLIRITNQGNATAEDVIVKVMSPADANGDGKLLTEFVARNASQGTLDCPLSHTDSNSKDCLVSPPTKLDTFMVGTIPAGQTATVEVINRYSGYTAGNMLNVSANATTSTAETVTTNNTSAQAFTLQAKRLVQGCDYRNMANVSPYPQTESRIANHFHALTFASKDTNPITLFGYSDTGEQAILNGDGFQWSGILQNGTYPSNIWAVAKADTGTHHVGVSLLGGLFWSDDRITWTPVTAFQGNALNDIAYAKGRYVAVGAQGTILTSVDGINWQQATSGTTAKLAYVDTGNNEFVVGGQGIILSSTDGLVWTTRATNTGQDASALEHGAVWNGSQYLLFDSAGNSHLMAANLSSLTTTAAIKPTVDGVTEVATARTWSAIYWQDNQYIALTTQGLLTSSDGRAWTTQQAIAYPYTYQRLADKAVIAGAHGSIWAAACAPVSVTPPPTLNYFVEQKDVSPATLLESNTLTVSGLAGATTLTITGGEYRKNGAAYTKAKGTVQNGDTLQVRHTTSSKSTTAVTTTLKLGKVAIAFKSTTQVIDSVPDAFSFNSQTDVPSLTWMESNVVTVSGVNAPIAISISGGEYRINNGSYTKAKGTVRNGDTLQVRHASSTKSKTTITTTLKLGTQSFTFKSTTLVIDSVPDALSFNALTDVARNAWQESASVTVSGINAPLAISISGGEYSINKGTYTKAKGMVKAGDTLQVRHLSAKSAKKSVTTTLTLGKSKVVFKSTTQ